MFDYLKKILEQVSQINDEIDDYKSLSPSGAMPSVAQVNKALKLLRKNKIEEAEKLLLEAEVLYPTNEVVFRTLGYVYEAQREFEKAIKYFKKAIELNPIKKDLFMRLGYAQLSIRRNEDAKKTFEQALKIFKSDSEVITGYGMALYRLERFEEARKEFVKAFSLDAHNLNALFLTATIDVMFKEYDRAETRLSLLVKVAPSTAHLYEYAKLKKLKADYEEAETLALKSLSTNKNFLPAYLLLAEINQLQLKFDDALKWIKRAENEELFTPALYLAKANVCMYKEDFQSAIEAYDKVLEFEQNETVDLKILVCKIMLDESVQLSEELAQQVQKEENVEKKAVLYMLLGIWNYKNNDLKLAERYLKNALQITLKLPVVYYVLAKIYKSFGDKYKTEKYFELALEKNPYSYDAYKDFIEFYIENGDFENAKFKIKKVLKLFNEDTYFENLLFHVSFQLLNERSSEYNVKELIKLAEKLEEKSSFLYADEKNALIEKTRG